MEQELLRSLQLLELEIVKEIDCICKKNNIPWMLGCGSVLGAVRHGGFIPWDDDIDIYMFEEDYVRFEQACMSDLDHEKYFLQTIDTDKEYPASWAKIRMNNTCSMEEAFKHKKMHWGVCVDIFRLQYAPKDDKQVNKLRKLKYLYLHTCFNSFTTFSSQETIKKKVLFCLLKVLRLRPIRKMLEKNIASYSKKTDYKRVIDDGGMDVFPAELFEERVMLPFEDTEFPCPSKTEQYLDLLYGNWRELPPENKRYGHKDIIVDLEKSYTHYQK